jgi:hypothetical protein
MSWQIVGGPSAPGSLLGVSFGEDANKPTDSESADKHIKICRYGETNFRLALNTITFEQPQRENSCAKGRPNRCKSAPKIA